MRIAIVLNPCDEGLSPAETLNPAQMDIFKKRRCPYCIFEEPLYNQNGYKPSRRCGALWNCANCDRDFFLLTIAEGQVRGEIKRKVKK